MARYIDGDKIIENLKKQYGEELGWQGPVNMSDIGMMIEKAPTADMVEVVRCKDCKRSAKFFPSNAIGEETFAGWFCGRNRKYVDRDDYCSYGERVTDTNVGGKERF